jgi:hypothetical protein
MGGLIQTKGTQRLAKTFNRRFGDDPLPNTGLLLTRTAVSSKAPGDILRVCPGTSNGITEFSEHEAD